MQTATPYLVRDNYNGTYDAVCVNCLATSAAYVRSREDLDRWHGKHACDHTTAGPAMDAVAALLRSIS